MGRDRKLTLTIIGDTKSLEKALAKSQASGKKFAGKGGLGGALSSLGPAGVAAAAGVAAVAVAAAAVAAAAVAGVVALDKAADAAANWGKDVIGLQRITGGTAEDTSALAAIFGRFGIQGKAMGIMFKAMTKDMTSGKGVLSSLGIATKDSSGKFRAYGDVIGDFAEKFKAMKDPVARNALAQKLFGRQWQNMLPILVRGKEGIAALTAKAKEYGLVLSKDNVAAVKKYVGAQKDAAMASQGAKVQFGLMWLPVKTALAGVAVRFMSWLSKLARNKDVQKFGDLVKTVFKKVPKVFDDVMDALAPVKDALAGVAASLGLSGKNAKTFGAQTKKLGDEVKNIEKSAEYKSFIKDVKDFAGSVARAVRGLDHLIKGIETLGPATGKTERKFGGLKAFLLWFAKWPFEVIGFFGTAFGNILGTIGTWCDDVEKWFKKLYHRLIGHSIIPDLIKGIVRWFVSLPGRIARGLQTFATNVRSAAQKAKNWMIERISSTISGVVAYFKGLPRRIATALGSFASTAVSRWLAAFKAAVQKVKDIWQSLMRLLGISSPAAGVHLSTPIGGSTHSTSARTSSTPTTASGDRGEGVLSTTPATVIDRALARLGLTVGAIPRLFSAARFATAQVGKSYIWGERDCSWLVSGILNAAGFNVGRLYSADMPSYGSAGKGPITVGWHPGHTGASILGQWFEAKGQAYGILGPGQARSDWPVYRHPSFGGGGSVTASGLARVHRGELIGTPSQLALAGGTTVNLTFNVAGDARRIASEVSRILPAAIEAGRRRAQVRGG